MPSYTAPVKDMQFILHDVLKVTGQDVPGYSELEADFTSAILEEAGKLKIVGAMYDVSNGVVTWL